MRTLSFPIDIRRLSTHGPRQLMLVWLAGAVMASVATPVALAQPPNARIGEAVPRDVRELYEKGMQYLAKTQSESGEWTGGQQGPGVTGMALMVFLASGEDPNFGIYSHNVRRAVRSIVAAQDANTGYLGSSMYHHGFATLALAEAYGAVDDRQVWPDGKKPRSIGKALELAVRAAITSQKKNSLGAWRYSPGSTDADTSVSGAVLVGLLAARNAGIEVPDEAIDRAISYYVSMTSTSGEVGYSGLGGFGESLDRHARLCVGPPERPTAIQVGAGSSRGTNREHRTERRLSGIPALLPGSGTLSGRCRSLEEMESTPDSPAQVDAATRWQFPGPVRPRVHSFDIARCRVELPIPAHL
jgi:hypothetical protein